MNNLTYQERLANYEREKKELFKSGNYTSEEFCQKLKALQDKWRI